MIDNEGNGVVWTTIAGSGETGNYTGGAGDAATASSDRAGFLSLRSLAFRGTFFIVGPLVGAVIDRYGTHALLQAAGAVFLGLTTGCAQCHSHKTDPLTQREFYELYAFFNEATVSAMPLDDSPDATSVKKASIRGFAIWANVFASTKHSAHFSRGGLKKRGTTSRFSRSMTERSRRPTRTR